MNINVGNSIFIPILTGRQGHPITKKNNEE